MPDSPIVGEAPQVSLAYMQSTFLVELILDHQQDRVRDLILNMPANQILPMLGASLAFAAELMRDQFGDKRAGREIATVRKHIGETGFEAVGHE